MKKNALIVASLLMAFFISCQSQTPTVCTDESGKPLDYSQGNALSTNQPAQEPQVTSEKGLPMVVKLGRDNCAPCIEMNRILEEVKPLVGNKATISIIDVSKEPDKAQLFGIRVIPTEIFYDSKFNEIHRVEGVIPKEEVIYWLKKGGAEL
jgi:thioredoxin 1